MGTENENSRRKFLRNTVLASLSAGLVPAIVKAHPGSQETLTCDPTTLDYYGQGPFYTADAPTMVNNQLATNEEPGTRLILSGVVQTLDCSAVIPNTLIDAWHANSDGQYDNVGYNLRGKTYSRHTASNISGPGSSSSRTGPRLTTGKGYLN